MSSIFFAKFFYDAQANTLQNTYDLLIFFILTSQNHTHFRLSTHSLIHVSIHSPRPTTPDPLKGSNDLERMRRSWRARITSAVFKLHNPVVCHTQWLKELRPLTLVRFVCSDVCCVSSGKCCHGLHLSLSSDTRPPPCLLNSAEELLK